MKVLRPALVSFALAAAAASGVHAAQQLGWEDLTYAIEMADDPYEGLSFEHQIDLEQLVYVEGLEKAGEDVDERLMRMADASRENLEAAGIDIALLLEKEKSFATLLEKAHTTLREDWNGQDIRIPGYVLPLEFEGASVKEFLLVPYVGACIHTPPPPANQIIHVTADASFRITGLFEPVWVSGVLTTGMQRQGVDLSDGRSEFDVGYQIHANLVEAYLE